MPTIATAASTMPKVGADAITISPTIVNVIPIGSEYGVGR